MNKNEIKKYQKEDKKVVTTSDILQSSFKVAYDHLDKNDYLIIENKRKSTKYILQTIEQYTNEVAPAKAFSGQVMTMKQNILLARKYIKENVFYLMRFESENVTFPDIEAIASNMKPDETNDGFDIMVTKNLMSGWKYILESPENCDLELLKKINGIIAKDQALEWGVLRTGKTSVSGTDYVPTVPTRKSITNLIDQTLDLNNIYESSAKLVVKLIKAQPFFDGNKRSAFLFVNRILIENSKGVLVVTTKNFKEFSILLNNYYNDEKQLSAIVSFIVSNCIYNTMDKQLVL